MQNLVLSLVLLPVSGLFFALSTLRRGFYRRGWLRIWRSPVPVVVVGNIVVGGTGKTPLVVALVKLLQEEGWSPGIVSRGYRGVRLQQPLLVTAGSSAAVAGDEPVMLFQRTGVPIAVFPQRPLAVQKLLESARIDIVICDDGLQHYALARDIEVVVIDKVRRHGNGWLLPAGPLREPLSRLSQVDFVVYNGQEGDCYYRGEISSLVRLGGTERRELRSFAGSSCHAVAGIGNPQRFFSALLDAGVNIIAHEFPDHHTFDNSDLEYGDDKPVIMTEKDAVKCKALLLDSDRYWYAELEAVLSGRLRSTFAQRVHQLRD